MSPALIDTLFLFLVAFTTLSAGAAQNCASTADVPPSAAISKAANVSTGNPLHCSAGTKFFPQPIDHSTFNGNYDNGSATFLQQYSINDTFYKPGGPILFFQNAEAPMTCVEATALAEWAPELGALMVIAEHRYFGLSCPYGLNYTEASDWNPKLLKDLTLDNVFLDAISLLTWVKTTAYPTAKDAKIIASGGSYGGFLSATMRVNHPDFFYGAIATAAPTKGVISDPLDEGMFDFGNWMDMVYTDYSAEAAQKIKASVTELRNRMASGSFDGLQQQLNLCTAPNDTSQIDALMKTIVADYLTNLQKNFAELGYPFYSAINATLAANDSMSVIGASLAIFNKWNKLPCTSWQANLSAVDPFQYIRCTYFPYPGGYTTPESIWGPVLPDYTAKHEHDYLCQPAFGIDSIDGGLEYQRQIGVDRTTLENTSRLLIVAATMDPTTGLAYLLTPGRSGNHSQMLYMNLAGHGQDLAGARSDDSEPIVQTRLFELNAIKNWLGTT